MLKRVLIGMVLLAAIGGVVLFILDRTIFAPVAVSDDAPLAPTIALATRAPQPTAANAQSTEAPEALETPQTAPAGLQLYRIDETQSEVRYEVGETIFRDNRFQVAIGRTQGIAGEVLIDFANPANSQLGALVIDISQFTSDEGRRDNFIRRNFLESARYPLATFAPKSIEGLPQTVAVGDQLSLVIQGDLTVKETTLPVTWDATLNILEDRITGSASTQILLSAFGVGPITIFTLSTEDEAKLFFDFVAAPASESSSTPAVAIAAAPNAGGSTEVAEESGAAQVQAPTIQEYDVPSGSRPHDVAPAVDGGVWYTAQRAGALGWLDPQTGATRHIALGSGSAPHGVIVGPDGAPWITDGGLNAIVRVDPATDAVQVFPLPANRANANLNTATFDDAGVLWFTGQNGIYGRLDPAVGQVEVFDAPRGRGPYGIDTTVDGDVYYASLANSYVGKIDLSTSAAEALEPPTPGQGARRVWGDSQGRVWVSEWNAGQLGMYDPSTGEWREWRLPGNSPMAYAVYVDERDIVWVSDFSANALVSFDPSNETFEVFVLPSSPADVRQILGRAGEVWGAESGTDKLVVIRTR